MLVLREQRSSQVQCAVLIPRLVLDNYIFDSPFMFSKAMIASEPINKLQMQMVATHAQNPHPQPS